MQAALHKIFPNRDALGQTPLHRIASQVRSGVGSERPLSEEAERFIKRDGPDVLRLLDRDGCTPLDRLVNSSLLHQHKTYGPLLDVFKLANAPTAVEVSVTAAQLLNPSASDDIISSWRVEREDGRYGTEALAWAQRSNCSILIKMMSKESSGWNDVDLDRWLLESTIRGRGLAVKGLLEMGADPKRQPENVSLLHLAIKSKNIPAVQALLKSGLNPNAQDAEGVSVLRRAVETGNSMLAYFALRAGASATMLDSRETSVSEASRRLNLLPPLETLVARCAAEKAREALATRNISLNQQNVSMEIA